MCAKLHKSLQPDWTYIVERNAIDQLVAENNPERAIAVDHAHMRAVFSWSMISMLEGKANLVHMNESPETVTRQLELLSQLTNERTFAVLGYALHHFTPEQIKRTLSALRTMTKDSALVITDYSLADLDEETIRKFTVKKMEEGRIAHYGSFDTWLKNHNQFNENDLATMLHDSGFNNVETNNLSIGRTTAFASVREDIDFKAAIERGLESLHLDNQAH